MRNCFKAITAFVLLVCLMCASARADEPIVLMSYNVHNGVGVDGRNSAERLSEIFREVCPTVAALQELDSMTQRSGDRDVLQEIADGALLEHLYSRAIEYDGGAYGIGTLYDEGESVVGVERISLPGSEEKRTLLLVEFEEFVFVNTHLSLTQSDRMKSIAIINSLTKRYAKPVFVAGDLNAEPQSEEMKLLNTHYTLLSSPNKPTYPADKPSECIDYIAVSRGSGVELLSAEVYEEPTASDHRAVVVRVKLK